MIQRRKVNSSKVNLTLSIIFHSVLLTAAFFFAAREGMLGKKLKQITVTMVPKEKKPEPPKQKPAEPKPEAPKVAEAPKTVAPAPTKVETAAPPPPASVADAPVAAPPPAALPAFEFPDGAKEVQTTTDANAIYKNLVEYALRSRWIRPDGIQDDAFVAEVEVRVDNAGHLAGYDWKKGSGDARWDNSVKQAIAQTKAISRPPPKGFPEKFLVRFDVESARTEPVMQLSSR